MLALNVIVSWRQGRTAKWAYYSSDLLQSGDSSTRIGDLLWIRLFKHAICEIGRSSHPHWRGKHVATPRTPISAATSARSMLSKLFMQQLCFFASQNFYLPMVWEDYRRSPPTRCSLRVVIG